MIVASVRVRVPDDEWIASVSRSFPEATFRLLAGVRTGESAVQLGEVVAEEPADALAAMETQPSVTDLQPLEVTDERALSRYETDDIGLYDFLRASSLPPEFPIVVEDGWFDLEFTGTREAFDRVVATLDDAGRPYELQSIVEGGDEAQLLTDRQRDVLRAGLRAGYFEVPRECTLAELAAELGIDTSTASGVLRRGEARILEWFFTGAVAGRERGTDDRS